MGYFYKADAIYEAAVARGYEGKFDGTVAGAVNALTSTYGVTSTETVDSLAFEKLGEALAASVSQPETPETPETPTTPTTPTEQEPEG